MPSKPAVVPAVFLASAIMLGWRAGEAGLATGWVDPLAKIQAQDEAVYAATSQGMALGEGWLTPKFLGRYALYKPPLLYWLSAAAVKAIGFRPLAIRLPSILAGAAISALVFAWVWAETSWGAAAAAVALLLSSAPFFSLSRLGLTDALLTLWIVAAMFVLNRSPNLGRGRDVWLFGIATGLAILTKSVAGVMPLIVLAAACVFPGKRVPWRRFLAAIGVAALIALPWHLYQLLVHPHWFWSEYVLTEMLAWGVSAPSQTTQESQILFYAHRLAAFDPILLGAGIGALVWRRQRVLLISVGVVCAEMLAFQYRNATYLLPLYPAFAVAIGSAITRWVWAADAVAVILMALRIWGLPFGPENVNPSYAALDAYAARHRTNELILIEPDDQFHSALLRLPKVRYVYVDPNPRRFRLPLDFEYLGITITEPEFNILPEFSASFSARLREFDLKSIDPVGTVILARNERELADLLLRHPEADFYVPDRFTAAASGRQVLSASPGRVFLLSGEAGSR